MAALTKADLAEYLSDQVGVAKREGKDLVECFFEEVGYSLESGEPVKISGFGNFMLRDKVSRPGRNPRTKVEVPISARRVVTFKASQRLKSLVEKYTAPEE